MTSRKIVSKITALDDSYVGEAGDVFLDSNNKLKVSDGVTPGGIDFTAKPSFTGAMVKSSPGGDTRKQQFPSGNTFVFYPIEFDNIDYDDGGWVGDMNQGEFIVPEGVSKVQVVFSGYMVIYAEDSPPAGGEIILRIRINDATILMVGGNPATTNADFNINTGYFDVTPGDSIKVESNDVGQWLLSSESNGIPTYSVHGM